jgi:D-amino-acid dehydrogenase
MQVAVIGGGIIGVNSAYFLARAGHDVVVIDRHGNVAEQATFGNAGLTGPGAVTHWSVPIATPTFLSSMLSVTSPLHPARWRWLRQWLADSTPERFQQHLSCMQRLAHYSYHMQREVQQRHVFSYEQTRGYLQLYRDQRALQQAQSLLDMLAENARPHQVMDATEARLIEPALSPLTPLAGALYLPGDEAGNCPLFAKQLKHAAQCLGVTFHCNTAVQSLQIEASRLSLDIDKRRFDADAIVLAAGIDSARLLEGLGIHLPLQPVKVYAATASIRNFDAAPQAALGDTAYKTIVTRLGERMRISGMAEPGCRAFRTQKAAFQTLMNAAENLFPDAANYNKAQFWSGTRNLLPDGVPLLGATPVPNVYVNMAHGPHSWAVAAGAGKIIADLVSGRTPDIDMAGLGLPRTV